MVIVSEIGETGGGGNFVLFYLVCNSLGSQPSERLMSVARFQDSGSFSVLSFTSDFSSNGIIKVSDRRSQDHELSESLSSYLNGGFTLLNHGTPSTNGHSTPNSSDDHVISFQSANDGLRLKNGRSIEAPNSDSTKFEHKLEIREHFPDEQLFSNIPHTQGMEQSKELIGRIIDSYHSERGAFLSKTIFLNNEIYSSSETIANGSVKINIIQEINELLRKFLPDVNGQLNYPTVPQVEATLDYHRKIMDAFEVVKNNIAEETIIEMSRSSSFKQPINRVTSIDSRASQSQNPSTSPKKSVPKMQNHKRSDSLLSKFRMRSSSPSSSRKKRLSVHQSSSSSTDSSNITTVKSHSRSVSTSTMASHATSSGRSIRDQVSLHSYFQTLEFLHRTLVEIQEVYLDSDEADIQRCLNSVAKFQSEYIQKFLLQDIFDLLTKFMKKHIETYV